MASPRRTASSAGSARRRCLAAGGIVVAATLAAAAPGPAWALTSATGSSTTTTMASSGGGGTSSESSPWCTASTLSQVRQLVENELAQRVTQLNTLIGRVDDSSTLTSSDRTALTNDLTQTELPGIHVLQSKVPNDTTCLQLRQDAHSMVWNYRVYLVVTPQTDLVITTDLALSIDAKLAGLETAISSRITNAQQHGHDVSGAQQAFSDYQAQVSAIQTLLATQSATVLAVTPAGYPGNGSTLFTARSNLQTAKSDFHTARNDLSTIRADLS